MPCLRNIFLASLHGMALSYIYVCISLKGCAFICLVYIIFDVRMYSYSNKEQFFVGSDALLVRESFYVFIYYCVTRIVNVPCILLTKTINTMCVVINLLYFYKLAMGQWRFFVLSWCTYIVVTVAPKLNNDSLLKYLVWHPIRMISRVRVFHI